MEATPGQNLFLTLDVRLQDVAEAYFRERVGSVVALDPKTGEILALVSSPSYDPNWFMRRVTSAEWSSMLENPDRPLQNRAIQNMYSPGSVIKPFMAYGALAKDLVDPSMRVFCPGHAVFYGRDFRCHKKGGHGWVGLRDAIKVSCDVYFYTLGQKLGIDRISEIATSFGFGRPTGVDLQSEKAGLVPSEEWARAKRGARWYPSETISVSIGQGPLLVTSMQVARALAGVLEGGRLPTPHLFYSSQDPRTREQLRYKAEFQNGMAIPPEKLAIVKDGMWAVVNEPGGTAYGSRVAGFEMGGKTGTAQVVGRETNTKGTADPSRYHDHAWFAGFGPVDKPAMVVVVFVENGGHGNLAAAPLAKALFETRFGIVPPAPQAPAVQAVAPGRPATVAGVERVARREGPMIGRALPGSRRRLGRGDPPRAEPWTLASLGVLFIASATTGTHFDGLASRQAIWIAVGLGAMTVAILFDYRMLLKFSFAIYCASLLPLVYLLFFGERIANVRSWIRIGHNFQFQPAELAKIATALLVAYLFENEDDSRLKPSTPGQARRDRRRARASRVPPAGHGAGPDLPAARVRGPVLRRAGGPRVDRDRRDAGAALRGGLVPAQGLPEAADRNVPQPRHRRAGVGLSGAPEQDRGRLGGILRKGLPQRHPEPAALPAGPAHGLHPGRHRRGVGVPRHHSRPGNLRRLALASAQARPDRPRSRRRVSDSLPDGNDVLLGRDQRVDDDRPRAHDGDPAPAGVLWGLLGRDDVPLHRLDSRRRLPPVRERVRAELLVNATPPETRVALLEDGRVVEVLHERRTKSGLVGNVYLGRVHRVLPGMQAAFVSIGLDRDAFLYVEDITPHPADFDFGEEPEASGNAEADDSPADRPRIDDLLKEGQRLVVQVTKDPMAGKGPGSRPGSPCRAARSSTCRACARSGSRAASRTRPSASDCAGSWRASAARADSSRAPRRGLGGGASSRTGYLTGLAAKIAGGAESVAAPALLHRELDLPLRGVRDLVGPDCAAIRVDDEDAGAPARAARQSRRRWPRGSSCTATRAALRALRRRGRDRERAPEPRAAALGRLLVIHQTEALVAIDVNTGRFVGKDALEETVFAVNLEAVPEVARQIRLRDLGGLLVVDFIDMEAPAHRAKVFARFEQEIAKDRARTRVLPLSEFGLIEVTRQRTRGNIERLLTRACPACCGSGRVKTDRTASLDLRRALLAPPVLFVPGRPSGSASPRRWRSSWSKKKTWTRCGGSWESRSSSFPTTPSQPVGFNPLSRTRNLLVSVSWVLEIFFASSAV